MIAGRSLMGFAVLAAGGLSALRAEAVSPEDAARGVLQRFIGPRAAEIRLAVIPEQDARPVFEIEATGGVVNVRGSSGVALSRGAYTYLREACHSMFTWGGSRVELPARWPDYPARRVVCPFRYVLQDNICTFGYTTAFYGWDEWQRYLDWMALHGCNLQMSPLGGEAIWARVWKGFGVTDAELQEFFTGPAFLPWHRMGNVNKHAGPLPAVYMEKSVALEKQILGHMRELGIHPIAPAFSGFVPAGFKRARPEAQVLDMQPWCGFSGPYGSHMLHPLSPLYAEIGKAFITEWHREFGPARFYQADSFNEMAVPVSGDRTNQLAQLAAFGDSVYGAIRAGDPEGTWVMMAWAFLSGFWTPQNAEALLSKVPNDRMIVLDLYAEAMPQWKRLNAYFGKQWVWSILPNWGGNSQIFGDLPLYAKTIPELPRWPDRGNLVGFGMSPEGTENNEVVYELATDAAWSDRPVDLSQWLESYCTARYGACPAPVREAWRLLTQSRYGHSSGSAIHRLQKWPAGGSYGGDWRTDEKFGRAAELMLEVAPQFPESRLFLNDTIELVSQHVASLADRRMETAVQLLDAGEPGLADRCMDETAAALVRVDDLLGAHSLLRLDRWVAMARKWGRTPEEQNYFEQNAKRQITVWGGSQLSEYSARLWSGMVGGYYAPRWQAWYESRRDGQAFDMRAWEEAWISTPGNVWFDAVGDPLTTATQAMQIARGWDNASLLAVARGEKAGGWRSGEPKETYEDRAWDVTALVHKSGALTVRFQYTGGNHRLDIAAVSLLKNGAAVSTDAHEGTTGIRNEGNVYKLELKEHDPAVKYVLRARIKSAGGTDSNGDVLLKVR